MWVNVKLNERKLSSNMVFLLHAQINCSSLFGLLQKYEHMYREAVNAKRMHKNSHCAIRRTVIHKTNKKKTKKGPLKMLYNCQRRERARLKLIVILKNVIFPISRTPSQLAKQNLRALKMSAHSHTGPGFRELRRQLTTSGAR